MYYVVMMPMCCDDVRCTMLMMLMLRLTRIAVLMVLLLMLMMVLMMTLMLIYALGPAHAGLPRG